MKPDFNRLPGTAYNFHSHTQFCDGRAPMEEFVIEAVRQGFTHYGFSPHSPMPIESPCNMSRDDVPAYLAEVERLQVKYGDKISLFTSMEIDYLGQHWGPSNPYFDALPLDYRIASVHFIPNQDGTYVDVDGNFDNFKEKMERDFNRDIRYVVETFYTQSLAMIEAGGFDIIGHFDKIGNNASHYAPGIEDEQWYQALVSRLIDAIAANGIVVEINTKAWQNHQRIFPSVRYFDRVKRAGIPIIVNSDAHFPALINASRSVALDLLG